MRPLTLSLLMMLALPAKADHTKEDAQATSAKLDAILHPRQKRRTPTQTQTQTQTQAQTQAQTQTRLVVDPLYALISHALTIPFDPHERDVHFRDIPKNAKELDAHLRRLDAALAAKHQHR